MSLCITLSKIIQSVSFICQNFSYFLYIFLTSDSIPFFSQKSPFLTLPFTKAQQSRNWKNIYFTDPDQKTNNAIVISVPDLYYKISILGPKTHFHIFCAYLFIMILEGRAVSKLRRPGCAEQNFEFLVSKNS